MIHNDKKRPFTVLVDLDGVVADIDTAFNLAWAISYPDRPIVPFGSRKSAKIPDDYPREFRKDIYNVLAQKGFVQNMPEVPGATGALDEMLSKGWEVFICSSPLRDYSFNVAEKFSWIEQHLGDGWPRRVIVAKDKTMVRGDYLIDNSPRVTGIMKPEWEHVIFDRPYNCSPEITNRRITWTSWEACLVEV